jgi:hypothetical protein
MFELPVGASFRAELAQIGAVFGELLDSLVAPIGHPDVPARVDRDPGGFGQLPWAGAPGANRPDEFAVFVELLQAGVVGVGDPDVSV